MSAPAGSPGSAASDDGRPDRYGSGFVVAIAPENLDAAVKRLKRAQGQIGGVIAMIEAGRDCEDVVTQLAAASRALDRAGVAIIAAGLRQCLTDSGGAETLDSAKMEKLFLSLA